MTHLPDISRLAAGLRVVVDPDAPPPPPKPLPRVDKRTHLQVIEAAARKAKPVPLPPCGGPHLRAEHADVGRWRVDALMSRPGAIPVPAVCTEDCLRGCPRSWCDRLAQAWRSTCVPGRHASCVLAPASRELDDAECVRLACLSALPRPRHYEPQTPRQAEALDRVTEWVDEYAVGGAGLYLQGPTGTGKTHLLAAAALALAERGVAARYLEWAAWITACWAFEDGQRAGALARVEEVDVLLVDAADVQPHGAKRSERGSQALEDLVAARYDQRRTTVVAVTSSRLCSTFLGARAASRLHETCSPVRLDGGDYRRRYATGGVR